MAFYTLGSEPRLLASHPRARQRGSWVVDEQHWDGLPGGERPHCGAAAPLPEPLAGDAQLAELMVRYAAAGVPVARRDPAAYDRLFATSLAGAP